MDLWIGALNLGFLYAFMAAGTLITFRILNFSDITVDGSFTTGAATTAVLITSGVNPYLALIAGFVSGALAGLCTGLIYTRLKINGLLAGILVMIALYSINLRIMGKSNIPLLDSPTFMTFLDKFNPYLPKDIWAGLVLIILMLLFWLGLSIFFKTDLGISIRSTGDNPTMALASGVNVNMIYILGLSLANGLVGLSGGFVAQYQGFADIGMGIGTLMIGLASVIIGESILKKSSIYTTVLSTIAGSVIYRLLIALALYCGMNPIDLKLFTSVFVLITLYISMEFSSGENHITPNIILYIKKNKRVSIAAAIGIAFIILLSQSGEFRNLFTLKSSKFYKIGVLQLTDNPLLDITRDSFSEEIKKLGYIDGQNCKIDFQNAQGDMPNVNTMLDKFIMDRYDIIIAISTGVTQAAINKSKDIPVVFASVANPFIIGAGTSEKDHLPNVTGVYGWVPMDRTIAFAKELFPGKLRIGVMWDPGQVNSVFNVEQLQGEVKKHKEIIFDGTTITNSSEVYQAAQSLVGKNIDMFVLPPDNVVYSAFDSIVKAGEDKKIPIFINEIGSIQKGALLAFGYDYRMSGIQGAHLADRILKGEDPKNIPFERYKKIDLGINLKMVKKLNITIPESLMSQATIICDENGKIIEKDKISPFSEESKKLALFRFNDNQTVLEVTKGLKDELDKSKILEENNITIYEKSAQNDFANAQSIAREILQEKYDYIITLSTPALQVMAGTNKEIPHVFGYVTDPYRLGVAKTSKEHQNNITGVATCQPVETTFKIMRELFPEAKKIGILWNPSEVCSQVCTEKARIGAKQYGFQLIEITVTGTSEIIDGVNTLVDKGIDLFITSGDNTVSLSVPTIAKILSEKKIPYFTNAFSDVESGAFISVGADYYEVGQETARMSEKVISGEKPEEIPIEDFVPEKIYLNLKLAKEFGINIPEDFIKRASKILK